MAQQLLHKINNNLIELTSKDYEEIVKNKELIDAVINKIAEGHNFDFLLFDKYLEQYKFDPRIIIRVFTHLKETDLETYINFVSIDFDNPAILEEFNQIESIKLIKEYQKNNLDEIINLIISNANSLYDGISNPLIIAKLMELKKYNLAYLFNPTLLTDEIENFIIESLNHNIPSFISTLSNKIFKKCQEIKHLELILRKIKETDLEYIEILIEAFKNGDLEISTLNTINYTVSQIFTRDQDINFAYLKEKIITKSHLTNEDINNVTSNEQLLSILLDIIEKSYISGEKYFSYCNINHPKVKLLALKYDFNFLCAKLKLDDFLEFYNSNPKIIFESIQFNLNNHVSEIFNLATNIKFDNLPKEISIEILKHLSIAELISLVENPLYTTDYHQTLISLIDETLTIYPKEADKLPDNFKLNKELPTSIIKAIIPFLNFSSLSPENISLKDYLDNVKVLESIFIRLKELKSNKFNSSLYEIENINSPVINSSIFDQSNPLNLTFSQILSFSGKIRTENLDYINTILNNSQSISIQDIYTLVNQLTNSGNTIYLTFLRRALPLVEDKSAVYKHIKNFFKNNNSNKLSGHKLDEQTQVLYEKLASIYEEYIKAQTNVPLAVTQYFNSDIMKQSSLDCLEGPLTNIDYFNFDNTTNINTVGEYLKESLEKGSIVNIEILYNISKKGFQLDPKYYNYPNISLDSSMISYIITSLLSSPSCSKLISRFIKTADIKNVLNISPDLYVPTYIDEFINRLKGSINDNHFNINSSFLLLLDNPSVNEANKNEILNIINKAIANNRIDDTIPTDSNLFASNNECVINFIKLTIKNNCTSLQRLSNAQKNIFSNQLYVDYLIELIEEQNLSLDYYFINSTSLGNPVFKKELVKLINENRVEFVDYINITVSYFDTDVYSAIMLNENVSIEVKKRIIIQLIHELASENTKVLEYFSESNIQITIDIICQLYSIENKSNLKKAIQDYGLTSITLIGNNDFIELLNSDEISLKRFFEIFKNREISITAVEGIIDSLKQNLFSRDNQSVIDFYTNSMAMIQRGITEEEKINIIKTLINHIPNTLDDIINKTNDTQLLNLYHSDYNLFMEYLLQCLVVNQNKYESIYHEITNNYIHQKRNEYRQSNNIYTDSKVGYRYEEKGLINAIVSYYLNILNQDSSLIAKLFEKSELNYQTIHFLNNPNQASKQYTKEEIISIKKNIKYVKSVLEKYIIEKYHLDTFTGEINNQDTEHKELISLINNPEFKPYLEKVKLIPIVPKNKQNLQELTKNLDYRLLRETILHDDDKYKSLIDILNKYGFLNWKDLFAPTINRLTIGEDGSEIMNFINAFSKIYDYEYASAKQSQHDYIVKETEKMLAEGKDEKTISEFINSASSKAIKLSISPYKIINYCVIYSSVASCYKIILGLEDFEFIKCDKGPNSSTGTRQERLDETAKLQIQMMTLKDVSIPSFIHEYKFDEQRMLNIIVGNKSDSRNLTHGERTGACMRSYGHAHDLFKFCTTDKRGFHFTILDSETGEYISRVSGFRNGNTIFLNQLRESLQPSKYSNEDLIEACKSVAKKIIEITHNDNQNKPIENVVVSTGYAVSAHTEETKSLSETDIGRNVYEGYKDVSSNAYIIATSNKNGEPVELDLYSEQPSYLPVRLPRKTYQENEIDLKVKISMQRIKAIKKCLLSSDQDYYNSIDIDLEQLESEYLYVIIGEDWFVALNSNLEIEQELIEVDERAYEEYNQAIMQIKEMKQHNGGKNHGK